MRDVYSFLQSFIFKSWTAQDPQKKKKKAPNGTWLRVRSEEHGKERDL